MQASVNHLCRYVFTIFHYHVADITLQRVGNDIVFHHNLNSVALLFFVFSDHDDSLVVVGNKFGYDLCSIGSNSDVSPKAFDFSFNMVYVNIANHNYCLVVWTIPLLVVSPESMWTETVNDRHESDWQAVSVLRVGE